MSLLIYTPNSLFQMAKNKEAHFTINVSLVRCRCLVHTNSRPGRLNQGPLQRAREFGTAVIHRETMTTERKGGDTIQHAALPETYIAFCV